MKKGVALRRLYFYIKIILNYVNPFTVLPLVLLLFFFKNTSPSCLITLLPWQFVQMTILFSEMLKISKIFLEIENLPRKILNLFQEPLICENKNFKN
jgi:hypothetical protein